MFVPVRDRPSVAAPTEAQDRPVMETKSAAIHRKMPMPARQLPITGFAHKTRVVGDGLVGAVLAARDMAAESCRAAVLDRRHRLQLAEAHMAGGGLTPSLAPAGEDTRDLQGETSHKKRASGGASGSAGLPAGILARFKLSRSSGLVTSRIVL